MEIKYQEHTIDEVTGFFARAFKETDKKRVIKHEAFVVPEKGLVIFKLYLENSTTPPP